MRYVKMEAERYGTRPHLNAFVIRHYLQLRDRRIGKTNKGLVLSWLHWSPLEL